jgi:chemotaxis-related protein WspB
MLALFFSIGPEHYAIPARSVVEVVPKVSLRSVPRSPAWFAGVFAYRGTVIGVIDLARRLHDTDCPSRLSNRIMVVARSAGAGELRYGMLTERVTEVRQLNAQAAEAQFRDSPLIAATVLQDGKLIQLLDLDAVLPAPDMLAPEIAS